MKISAVIPTKNEEGNIVDCIGSLDFCDEIVVVDDNSTDDTVVLAKGEGAKIFKRSMNEDFSAQLNFGMEKAKNKWIFFIDADERVGKELAKEIGELKEKPGVNGYLLGRKDHFFGKRLRFGDVLGFSDMRLVRRGAGERERRVHPTFKLLGKSERLKGSIDHYPHKSLNKFLSSINTWSSWHAIANHEEGKKPSIFKILTLPILKFVRNYIFRLGFLDGLRGFIHAFYMSLHSFLAWAKLWIFQKDKR